MRPSPRKEDDWFQKLKCSQAVDKDYGGNSFFDRGHLNPNGHHNTPESRDATFTLTNAVPQYRNANAEWARQYEEKIKVLTNKCTKTFIITGTIPGNTLLNARVNVPEYIWSSEEDLTN
nr:PREDICTED: endonuclease domain-containing 1 protein-like [Latimeria chalumnae]|eukprot:XP_014354311.1 PREDICTED: endonuclease domain-containing 1 protein-like [Latimeria chalumnae]